MSGPLSGVRILDMSNIVSGPMAVQILADQGADVIKIEQPGIGDLCRQMGAQRGGMGSLFAVVNRNKRSVVLDLKLEQARSLLLKMAESADVLVQNFRPGAMERMGLSYDELKRRFPKLIYVSISGFGPDGPYAERRVYDPVIQAVTGFIATQKTAGSGDLDLVKNLVCDKATALTAAQAITAALFDTQRSGQGQHVEVAMVDAGLAFLWPDGMWNHTYQGEGIQPMPALGDIYRISKTQDGYVTYIAVSDSEWQGICRALNREDLIADERFASLPARIKNIDVCIGSLESEIAKWETEPLCERLDAEEVPYAKVNTLNDVADDPQVKHRNLIVDTEDEHVGAMRLAQAPARFNQTVSPIRRLAPQLGEHTDEVLTEFGYSPSDVEAFRSQGVLG